MCLFFGTPIVVATEDLERIEELAYIYDKVEYNRATIAKLNQKIDANEVVQGLRQQIMNQGQKIKSLEATINRQNDTIKQKNQTIQQHQDYLDDRLLNHDFEKYQNEDLEQTQSFTFHHRRI